MTQFSSRSVYLYTTCILLFLARINTVSSPRSGFFDPTIEDQKIAVKMMFPPQGKAQILQEHITTESVTTASGT